MISHFQGTADGGKSFASALQSLKTESPVFVIGASNQMVSIGRNVIAPNTAAMALTH